MRTLNMHALFSKPTAIHSPVTLASKVLSDVHLAPVLAGELAQAMRVADLELALVPASVCMCVCVLNCACCEH